MDRRIVRKMRIHKALQRCCFAGLLSLALVGCVSRRMTIRSEPSGALVEVDGERLGVTPLSLDFDYYGTREISLAMPGFDTLTVQQPVPKPFYQRFPLDFVSNHFIGGHVTDRHDYIYKLTRSSVPIDAELDLINRGRNFRSKAQVGPVQ